MSEQDLGITAEIAVDAVITRNVRALLAWHGMNAKTGPELAVPLGTSEDTMARRLSRGGWTAGEVFAVAAFFRVPVAGLYDVPDLARSEVDRRVRLSRQHEGAGQETFSGSDIEDFLTANETTLSKRNVA